MKTINDFLVAFREDRQLSDLITNSYAMKREYKPRRYWKTKSGLAASYLWDSIDGAKLRLLIEEKYEANLGNTRLVGKLKTALHLFLGEVMRE
jgi:hypothetical protein